MERRRVEWERRNETLLVSIRLANGKEYGLGLHIGPTGLIDTPDDIPGEAGVLAGQVMDALWRDVDRGELSKEDLPEALQERVSG